MKKIYGFSAVVSCLLLFVVLGPLALAQGPASSSENPPERVRPVSGQQRERVVEARNEKREEIQEIVAERRAEVRFEVCERRQERLQQRISQLTTRSTRLLGVIDTMYARVQGFYDSGKVLVDDYEQLNDQVAIAQEDALASVEAAASYSFDVDCEDRSVGDQMYAFRTAVSQARESLKTYRTTLVTLISSMRTASDEQADNEVESSEDQTSNSETPIEEDDTSNIEGDSINED